VLVPAAGEAEVDGRWEYITAADVAGILSFSVHSWRSILLVVL
jgi:hypothetical protein